MTGQPLGAPGRPIAKVHRTTDLLAGAGGSYVTWDTKDIDTDNMVDLVTNPDRITIKTPGIYVAQIVFRQDFTGGILWIHGGSAGTLRLMASKANANFNPWGSAHSHPKVCATGEFYRIFLDTQNMLLGGSGVTDYSPFFSVWRLDV